MELVYLYTFASVILVSFVSFVGIFALSLTQKFLRTTVFVFVSLAVGALLGDTFIHLIPEAFESNVDTILISILIISGFLIFFIFEKFLHWHHAHGEEEEIFHQNEYHKKVSELNPQGTIHPIGRIILFSDGFHNFIDGIIIGVSFLASIEIGIATTIAVILHEIPQEIGDFGVLLHAGYTRARALLYNFFSGLLAILGAGLALLIGASVEGLVVFLIPIAAGGFLYVAGSDLIPELHKTKKIGHTAIQFIAIIVGVLAMLALVSLEA